MSWRPVATVGRVLEGLLRPGRAKDRGRAEGLGREIAELHEVAQVLTGVLALAGAARATMGSDPEGADDLLGRMEREVVPTLERLQARFRVLNEEREAIRVRR